LLSRSRQKRPACWESYQKRCYYTFSLPKARSNIINDLQPKISAHIHVGLFKSGHENWLEANRYLNMSDLKEMKKIELRQAA